MIEIPRFYKNKVPEIDEYIFCNVKEIDENCIYFHILEYNIDVMVPFKDLNECRGKKAKFKIAKKYKLNTNHIFYVTNTQDNLEISNRGVDEKETQKFIEEFNKKKLVINIFKDFLVKKQIFDKDCVIEYAEKTIWKISPEDWYNKIIDIKFNQKIDIFDINEEDKEIFIKYINHSINDIKYSLIIETQIISIGLKGINQIKEILDKINKINVELKKSIKLINAPLYCINIESENIDILKEYIEKFQILEDEFKINEDLMFSCDKKEINNNLNKDVLRF